MANYDGYCRANYFRLHDEEAVESFRELCEHWGLRLLEGGANSDEPAGLFSFYVEDGGYPTPDGEEGDAVELWQQLAPLLADGSVCIIEEVGHEKMRYLNGWAVAFTNRCDPMRPVPDMELTVSLGELRQRALDRWGGEVTEVNY
jgi:hypothetical protein